MKLFFGLGMFKRAYEATRREIFTSLIMLILITLVFTVTLWLAERGGINHYSFGDALVWVVVKYVEDPADIATPPATIYGQVIGTMVGILGIAIFAVPAGLIGSGLLDAMSEEKKDEKVQKNSKSLHKRFRRIPQPDSYFVNDKGDKVSLRGVPRFWTVPYIKMKTGMSEDDVVAAVKNCPDMRMMNLAMAKGKTVWDDLVVVHFPVNTEYGCFLDRGSDVTIVAPVALTELGTGNFSYNLAAMGEFNYVSRELAPDYEEPFGFYSMRKSRLEEVTENQEEVKAQALHFMSDLQRLKENSAARGRRHWFIFFLATTKSVDWQVHLWRLSSYARLPKLVVNGKECGSTVLEADEHLLQSIREALSVKLESRDLKVCLDNTDLFKSVYPENIMCRMGGGISCNALTMRVAYDILVSDGRYLVIAKDIAEVIKEQIEHRMISQDVLKPLRKEGDSFADASGETEMFESDPAILKKDLELKQKMVLSEFGTMSFPIII